MRLIDSCQHYLEETHGSSSCSKNNTLPDRAIFSTACIHHACLEHINRLSSSGGHNPLHRMSLITLIITNSKKLTTKMQQEPFYNNTTRGFYNNATRGLLQQYKRLLQQYKAYYNNAITRGLLPELPTGKKTTMFRVTSSRGLPQQCLRKNE